MSNIDCNILKWICGELSKLLGTDATEEVARYLLSIENSNDLKDYLHELLDSSKPDNAKFITDLLQKWKKLHSGNADNVSDSPLISSSVSSSGDLSKKSKKGKRNSNESNNSNMSSPEGSQGSSKKTTFVPLFSSEGQMKTVAMLPGRHPCECQALKHSLVNNCLNCGRVVCQQEGPGPCFFCDSLVCTKEQQEILARNSRKSEKLLNQLMSQTTKSNAVEEGYEKALKHKNKLLEYDRTSVKRTQVIDDESDYFSTDGNKWLKEEEKAALKKREEELRSLRHASRKDRKITLALDFAGRRVVEEEPCIDMYDASDPVVQAANFGTSDNVLPIFADDYRENLVNPNINFSAPTFLSEEAKEKKTNSAKSSVWNKDRKAFRIQDGDLEQMSDNGMAMSMHQPWASLLVSGIKRHEGRSWFTQHRGTLWIAATAKVPSPEEINQVEEMYRLLYNDPELQFPKAYPVSCLLGSVDVQDCLAHEDYVEKYPGGESESPYVFICENPRELPIKFPIKGKHKIYKLDPHLHKAGKKGINVSHT